MSKHIHADHMVRYAEDAQRSEMPWEHWEFKDGRSQSWEPVCGTPLWNPDAEYRRVATWPEPYLNDVDVQLRYWTIAPREDGGVYEYAWDGDRGDYRALNAGLAYRTRADAEAALRMLARIVPGSRL